MKLRKLLNEIIEDSGYLYHGTHAGAALSIQRDGFLKLNSTGESDKTASFSGEEKWAAYYAKSKGGNDRQIILRTKKTDDFKLSDRIVKNKNAEWITFKPIPISELDVKTKKGWIPLESWDFYTDGVSN